MPESRITLLRGLRRVGGLAAASAGLALLAVGCSSSGSSSHPRSYGSAGPSQAAAPTGIQIPARIGSLTKSADQSTAKFLLSGMDAAVRKKIRAVSYDDGADSSRKVLVYGGVGLPVPPGDPGKQLKQMLRTGTANGVKIDSATTVATGPAGGTAACAQVGTTKNVNCGWISGKDALVMSFQGFDKGAAQSFVPQILAAMVRT
ncbi:MAG TPA: hypothetical protein VFI65_21045 [Streptosporangiaceae bacterium]|nr:hypothetical protein [Streptosporangiaceae bacterium]